MLEIILDVLSLVFGIYIFFAVRSLQAENARLTQPTHHEEQPSDFDERILAFQAELDLLNAQKELENYTPGTLYDLPHASVKTTPKFNPEYAD